MTVDDTAPEINITPLIDVVFVILIGFIMIAPMLEMDKINLAEAGKDAHEIEAKAIAPLQITVRRDNSIVFNQREVTLDELKELLVYEKQKHPDERPKLMQDKHAYFGTYQDVKNVLVNLGYEELDIILNPAPK